MPFSGSGATAAQPANITRRTARLVVNPSTTSGGLPYGGTYVGLWVAGAGLRARPRVTPLRFRRGYGALPYAYRYGGYSDMFLAGELAEYDDDTIQLAFPGSTVLDAGAGQRRLMLPGASVETHDVSSGEVVSIALIPHDPLQQALYLRAVLPWVDPDQDRQLLWRLHAYGSLRVLFRAMAVAAGGGVPAGEELGASGLWPEITL